MCSRNLFSCFFGLMVSLPVFSRTIFHRCQNSIGVRIHSEPGNGLCLEDSAFAVVVLVLGFRGVVGAGEGLQSLCIALRISSCVSDAAKNFIPPSFINQEGYIL